MLTARLVVVLSSGGGSACDCPESIGADAGSPPLIVASGPAGLPGLVACGYLESRDGTRVRASEFEVFPCGSHKSILTFGASETGVLRTSGRQLLITELTRWPFGPNWKWVDVPLWEYALTPGQPPHVSKFLALQAPHFSNVQVREVLRQYKTARTTHKSPDDFEELTGRLLGAALSGNDEARAALAGLRVALNLDGADAETWQEAVNIYELYARTTGKIPLLPH